MSNQISRWRLGKGFQILQEEDSFYTQMGLVPCYLATLNTCTVLKLWGTRAKEFFGDMAKPFPDEGYSFWELAPAPGSAQYSSLNFVLVSESQDRIADSAIQSLLEKYYVYGFWDSPEEGFTCSPSIIYDSYHIREILKITKGLYIPTRIFPQHFHQGNVEFDGDVAELWGIGKGGALIRVEPWLTKDIAAEINNLRLNSRTNPLVNGVVLEFRRRTIRLQAFSVIGGVGSSPLEVGKSLVGFICSRIFHDSETLCGIGEVNSLWKEVKLISRTLGSKGCQTQSMDDFNIFEKSLQELFPVVVTDDGEAFFLHPAAISVLAGFGILERCMENPAMFQSFAFLLDLLVDAPLSQVSEARDMKTLESKGVPPKLTLSALARMARLIAISKAMRGAEAETPDITGYQASIRLAICPKCERMVEVEVRRLNICTKCGTFIPAKNIFDLG